MKILIVNLHFKLGGVETIFVKLIPEISKRGHEITLLLLQNRLDDELINLVKEHCKIILLKDLFPFNSKKIKKYLGCGFDIVLYTIGRAVITGTWLLQKAAISNARTAVLTMQTELFCPEPDYYHNRLLLKLMREDISPVSIIFGNNAGRMHHQYKLGVDLSQSMIVDTFVDIDKYKYRFKFSETGGDLKIVSIGRVVDFKTYNFTIINVIDILVRRGLSIEWHIYGDGDMLDKLKAEVLSRKLSHCIFTHGLLKYSRFQKALEDADLFIGSGISLIEAAACGVPSLSTIEYSKSAITYGFICDIPGNNLIEPGLDIPVYEIVDLVQLFSNLSKSERKSLADRCLHKAKEYGANGAADRYIEAFEKVHKADIKINNFDIFLCLISYALFIFKKYTNNFYYKLIGFIKWKD